MTDTNNQVTHAIHLTDEDLSELLKQGSQPIFVDFYATWCGPCQIAAPIIDKLAKEYADKVIVAKVDVDENPMYAKQYDVMSIPTVLVFNKVGDEMQVVDRLVGFRGEPSYRQMLDKVAPAQAAKAA